MAVTQAQVQACLANNISGSFSFQGMRNMSTARQGHSVNLNNQTRAEWAWHIQIDALWPGLNQQGRNRVRAFCARWGPLAQPANPQPGTYAFFRAKYWRTTNGVPRCATCSLGHGGMPQGGNIPIGLDNVALMPCGCNEEEADIKHWLIGMNGWTRTQTIQGRLKMGVIGRDIRLQFLQSYKVARNLGQNTVLTFAALSANGQTVQGWPAHY